MNRPIRMLLSFTPLVFMAGLAGAQPTASLVRDTTYEQNLRWEASADKTITPAKVLRWLMSHQGQTMREPSRTEFQPIVNVHDSNVRVVAAIAYKF